MKQMCDGYPLARSLASAVLVRRDARRAAGRELNPLAEYGIMYLY